MFQKRAIIFLFSFLFLQNQFTTFVNASECETFGKKVDEKYDPILPDEEKNDLGIYWVHVWNENKQKITVKRDKYNFPIVDLSLLEKKEINEAITALENKILKLKKTIDIKKI